MRGARRCPSALACIRGCRERQQTRIEAKSERVGLENSHHLPAGELDVRAREDWNFATLRRLPEAWINNAFLGWNGRASIVWPDRRMSLEISAEAPISAYIVYSPGADADFFCFEPVTHPVDAHNLPGGPEANGLSVLEPEEEMSISCRFAPSRGRERGTALPARTGLWRSHQGEALTRSAHVALRELGRVRSLKRLHRSSRVALIRPRHSPSKGGRLSTPYGAAAFYPREQGDPLAAAIALHTPSSNKCECGRVSHSAAAAARRSGPRLSTGRRAPPSDRRSARWSGSCRC